jgi:arylformamidase
MAVSERWQGWRTLPGPPAEAGWIDLSHPLTDSFPYPSYFAAPRIGRVMSLPDDPLNLTRMEMMCHYGTHVDAPNHFIDDAPGISDVPLDRLAGEGVVWRIEASDNSLIGADALDRASPAVRPGGIVLIDTGWARYVGTDRYSEHPSLGQDAADWLVDHEVKLVGFDVLTPDLPVHRRPKGFAFPIHRTLLAAGTLIVENVRNLDQLAGSRAEVLSLPLPLVGADGSPIRLLARPLA